MHKTKAQKLNEKKIRTGIFVALFIWGMLVAIFRLGFLGICLANILRFFVGSTFRPFAVLLICFAIKYFMKIRQMKARKINKKPAHSKSKINLLGVYPFYLGLITFLHIKMFENVAEKSPHIFRTTIDLWMQDFFHLQMNNYLGGGIFGSFLYTFIHFLVSQIGSYIVSIISMLVGGFLFLPIDLKFLVNIWQKVLAFFQNFFVLNNFIETKKAKFKNQNGTSAVKDKKSLKEKFANLVRPFMPSEILIEGVKDHFEQEKAKQTTFPVITSFKDTSMPSVDEVAKKVDAESEEGDDEPLKIEIKEEPENFAYILPSISLFSNIPEADQSNEHKRAVADAKKLETTFASFGIDIRITGVNIGPSVTKYEMKPPAGVKVSRIISLADDIALALAAKDVRMEAPIPGKSLIGIEIPNKQISTVSFRDVVENTFNHSDKLLEVPLGRDIAGEIQVMDLEKMPHILIAGSTGSGKSVAINGIISSILMKAKPNEVKLMMIDPKMVELSIYNGIPHLLTPVVINPRKAAQALNKVVEEMERRYELFSQFNVRKISSYNGIVQKENVENGENQPTMPLIVVIVDELADLMMIASKDVEDAIIRLGQKARAAGIHMILATQRPSVDVISGLIKANVPSRIAFAVSSGTDSRTILDSNGAEKLLGQGDMLYKPIDANHPIRVQGSFLSDAEVLRLVDFVKDQQGANYNEQFDPGEVVKDLAGSNGSLENDGHDDYFEEAKHVVIQTQTASASFIQRRFKTGYNRALRIVEELEKDGVIGPSVGTKPREVLIKPDFAEIKEDLEKFSEN
ncbi:MAG: cell division protein FtsK [Lactobacillales bacterium]|jgi:S-DNA-T family DNA segregation ATPase FtsK/SpoIIIE|nr:cell division protein FtsK [Lactobacillales bacterium]